MAWRLFEYVDPKDQSGVVTAWLETLNDVMRGRAKAKLIAIQMFGDENKLPGMVTDTVEPTIKELVLNSNVALRVFLCRGPQNVRSELTFLGVGQEKDKRYISRPNLIDPASAEIRRYEVAQDPANRRRPYEFPSDLLG